MTKRTLEKIKNSNEDIYKSIEGFKRSYKYFTYNKNKLHEIGVSAVSFLNALKLTGFITNSEFQCIYIYITSNEVF